jgi:hypothetical protein
MDWLQFISSIVQLLVSLAWPAAFVAAVWLFREKLNTLLPLLRMKYKDLDVSFRLEKAEEEAAALPKPSPEQAETMKPTTEEKSRTQELAELSPKLVVLEARADVEEAVRRLAQVSNIPVYSRGSLLQLTRVLRNKEIIERETAAVLDDLRALGNQAAHNADVVITKEDAFRYKKLADEVVLQLRLAEVSN